MLYKQIVPNNTYFHSIHNIVEEAKHGHAVSVTNDDPHHGDGSDAIHALQGAGG